MTVFLLIIAFLVVAACVFFILKNKKSNKPLKNQEHRPMTVADHINTAPRRRFNTALEASWAFLQDIAEAVVNRFNPKDHETLIKLGSSLLRNGLQYKHVVDARSKAEVARNLTQTRGTSLPGKEGKGIN